MPSVFVNVVMENFAFQIKSQIYWRSDHCN